MNKPNVVIKDAQTGEIIEREMTVEEIAQWETDKAAVAAKIQADAEAQAKREAALEKLAALGIDADDLKALGL